MPIRKTIAAIPDKNLNITLFTGIPVVALALLFLGTRNAHRSQALEMRCLLATLTARDIARVVVVSEDTAYSAPSTAAKRRSYPTVVIAPIAVQKLLIAYQHASSYGPGGGRLSGWKAQADFHLRTGQVIYSTIYQNDYASLLFIASDSTHSISSLDDCLMSQTAGPLLKELSSQAL